MPSDRRRAGLPSNYEPGAVGSALDRLTTINNAPDEPPGTPGNRVISGSSGGAPVAIEPKDNNRSEERKPAPRRRHIKVGEDRYAKLRAGVWHNRTHGRPRLLLDELIDEIVDEWYERAKAGNGGEDLEDFGPLR
jgi:hypothetical protein